MKVSVALHFDEPNLDGNQRTNEFAYMGYNRQYVDLVETADGNFATDCTGAAFPVSGESCGWTTRGGVFHHATWFSIAVCEDVPPDCGGSIIIYGPIDHPQIIKEGSVPKLATLLVGVRRKRILDMVADGRMSAKVLNHEPLD